jgi:hypothetical protein
MHHAMPALIPGAFPTKRVIQRTDLTFDLTLT